MSMKYQVESGQGTALIIGRDEKGYGASTDSGEVLIEYIYDNIIQRDQNIYLAVKDGKTGLIHLEWVDTGGFFVICNTECIYEYAEYHEEFVILTLENGKKQVYFIGLAELTFEYDLVHTINDFIVEMTSDDDRILVDVRDGELLDEDLGYEVVSFHDTVSGMAFVEEGEEGNRILILDEYSGETIVVPVQEVIRTILSSEYENCAIAFVVLQEEGMFLVEADGSVVSYEGADAIDIEIAVSGAQSDDPLKVIAVHTDTIEFGILE